MPSCLPPRICCIPSAASDPDPAHVDTPTVPDAQMDRHDSAKRTAEPDQDSTISPGSQNDQGANSKRQKLHYLNDHCENHHPSASSFDTGVDDLCLCDLMLVDSGEQYSELGPEVCEIYSPPRVVPIAKRHGFAQGWSLDL